MLLFYTCDVVTLCDLETYALLFFSRQSWTGYFSILYKDKITAVSKEKAMLTPGMLD